MQMVADMGGWTRAVAKRIARAVRDERGGIALEFAELGPMFIIFLVMIIELGIVLFQQAMLDYGTQVASRLIRTGQVQLGGGASMFTAAVCANVGTVIPCGSLQYYVQAANSFSSLNSAVVTDGSGNLANNGTFNPGTAGQEVLVQVAYKANYVTPWLNGSTGALIVSTVSLQNEQYQ
jgi:Flp pilus assembly protein TadG